LKEFRDRKGVAIEKMLKDFLDIGEILCYNEYLDTKYKIIEERREVEEKIQLGEQMIYALKTAVMVSQNLVKNS